MRFGDYIWPHNPRVYEIEYRRCVACHKVPFGTYVLSNMGREQRILRGEGEFAGPNAYEEFKKLATIFYLDKPNILIHPVWQSARAWFVGLKLKQEPRKDYVSYEFEFWECFDGYELSLQPVLSIQDSPKENGVNQKRTYIIKKGDTLWGVAKMNGLSLSEILALNPQIRNPNICHPGDTIYLS
ncbi:MAG: LysM peptidoglycan-binding domain-containing protein [Clostridiales bacterium]|nr:LysM peptidoglycan-binding domain-containing protein [Clostridiales bacterium]